jgi:hypothetical protein
VSVENILSIARMESVGAVDLGVEHESSEHGDQIIQGAIVNKTTQYSGQLSVS